jgi:acylphosphatase
MKTRCHIFVSGRVQGVFFRAYTKERAIDYGVSGWVKNRRDGRVEAVFEGDKKAIEKLIDDLKRGPPHGRVDNIDVGYEDYLDELRGFHVVYD